MLSAAATAYYALDPLSPMADEAKTIINKVNGWAARRNDIAHGRVGTIQSRPGYLLYPSLYNTKKHPMGAKPTFIYSSAELNGFKDSFVELQKRINFFRRIIARSPKPSPETQPQQ
jgi:hypothetical protein